MSAQIIFNLEETIKSLQEQISEAEARIAKLHAGWSADIQHYNTRVANLEAQLTTAKADKHAAMERVKGACLDLAFKMRKQFFDTAAEERRDIQRGWGTGAGLVAEALDEQIGLDALESSDDQNPA